MNKQDIAEKVHGVLGGTKADAERAVESMIDTILACAELTYKRRPPRILPT